MFLWLSIFQNHIKTLRICMCFFSKERKGTSFFICQRASLTLEAAVVVPIAVCFLACILFFFRMIQVQAAVEESLMYVGRELAIESCILNSEESLLLAAEVQFRNALGEHEVVEQYVRRGRYGVNLGKSEVKGENILLCAEYDIKLPVKFFELGYIRMCNVNQFRKWNGRDGEIKITQYVYVTESGRVYHQDLNCRVLDLSVCSISLSEINTIRGFDGQKYYPCDTCFASGETEDVFYTNYGTKYHSDISCNALKRTVKKILKSDCGNKKACSFCFP